MDIDNLAVARRIADEVVAFERESNGRDPELVTVAVCDGALIVTFLAPLTPAERATAENAVGAEQIQKYRRELFVSASENLSRNIERISGVHIGAATARIDAATGTVVEGLSTGNELEVFMFAGRHAFA
jgi:uncharacterized protein YbcI